MGSLFGGYLSRSADVTIVDVNEALVKNVRENGVTVLEKDGSRTICRPDAVTDTAGMEPADLVIVFVKAMFSKSALTANKGIIGADTYLMTLQNGSGHEDTLLEFADKEHVIIGTTQHNSSVESMGTVRHGGSGHTYLGVLTGDVSRLQKFADVMNEGGLEASVSTEVLHMIWNKMFTNVSASVLTGILQCPLGFIYKDEYARQICRQLVMEAVAVAKGEGLDFDAAEKIEEVENVCKNAPEGYTSIYADLRDGRKSEVDTISGSIVRASERNGVPAPTHRLMVSLVHAMEDRKREEK